MSQPLTYGEFTDQLREAFLVNGDGGTGHTVDVEKAWKVYAADPEPWHKVTGDNETGSPAGAFILEDGPWWVPLHARVATSLTDMPNEDELEQALLDVARELGQCPYVDADGRQCNGVAGHTYPDHYYEEETP